MALVAAGVAVWGLEWSAPEPSQPVPFVPAQDNDRVILVRGWQDAELRKITDEFCKQYEVPAVYNVVPSLRDPAVLQMTFPGDVQPELFLFLVNYINYPKDFDLKGRSIAVVGKTTLSPALALPDKSLIGQHAKIYVPADDRDYDVVYVRVDDGDTWAVSFSNMSWKRVHDPRVPYALKAS